MASASRWCHDRTAFIDGTSLDGFRGVMISFGEGTLFAGSCPGWECTTCGWRIGAQGKPPPHLCPTMGEHRCTDSIEVVRRAGRDWDGPGEGWIECRDVDCLAHPRMADE